MLPTMLITPIKIIITILDVILAYMMFSGATDARRRLDADAEASHSTDKTEAAILNVCGGLHLVNAVWLWI